MKLSEEQTTLLYIALSYARLWSYKITGEKRLQKKELDEEKKLRELCRDIQNFILPLGEILIEELPF